MSKDRDECLRLGCDDHISKPIEWDHFFRKLAALLKTCPVTHDTLAVAWIRRLGGRPGASHPDLSDRQAMTGDDCRLAMCSKYSFNGGIQLSML